MKTKKDRLDKIVFEKGLAKTRANAQALILSGSVVVDGKVSAKPGMPVACTAEIFIKKPAPYVSRGGLKLESAFKHFKISLLGKTCMDIGASTGGFSDFMLQHGARKVYAVDVGKNLLHERLKKDPRIVNIEKTNFRYFPKELLKENIEFVTIDVSFISLGKIIPVAKEILAPGGEMVALVKPQFESPARELKNGVVKDESVRQKAIEKIKTFSNNLGLTLLGEADSGIKGPEGNIEHFLWLKKSA